MSRAISIDQVYISISANQKEGVELVVERVVDLLVAKPQLRISFAAGQSLIPLYEALVSKILRDEIDCSQIECFQLCEYYPCSEKDAFSFAKYLRDNVVRPLFLAEGQFHFIDASASDPEAEARRFELLLHDIDVHIIGIGPGGHIAFDEPGTAFDSRTRLVDLSEETVKRDHVYRGWSSPTQAITQGIGNILEADHVFIPVFGEQKAQTVQQVLRDPISEACPASVFRSIPKKAVFFLDEAAAKLL